MATVVRCPEEKKKCGGHDRKKYVQIYGRMVEIAIEPLPGTVRECLEY